MLAPQFAKEYIKLLLLLLILEIRIYNNNTYMQILNIVLFCLFNDSSLWRFKMTLPPTFPMLMYINVYMDINWRKWHSWSIWISSTWFLNLYISRHLFHYLVKLLIIGIYIVDQYVEHYIYTIHFKSHYRIQPNLSVWG